MLWFKPAKTVVNSNSQNTSKANILPGFLFSLAWPDQPAKATVKWLELFQNTPCRAWLLVVPWLLPVACHWVHDMGYGGEEEADTTRVGVWGM
jgi:hypothetical protein